MARRIKTTKSKKLIEKFFDEPEKMEQDKLLHSIRLETDKECWNCSRFKLNKGKCFGMKSLSPCLAYDELSKRKNVKAS